MVNSIRLFKNYITSFDNCESPVVNLEDFIKRIIINGKFIGSEIVISLIYFDRFNQNKLNQVNENNVGIVFAISLLLAEKWLSDYDLIITEWPILLKISFDELKLLEIEYLFKQNWNMHITKEEYKEKYEYLQTEKKEFLENVYKENKSNTFYFENSIDNLLSIDVFENKKYSNILLSDILIRIVNKYQLELPVKRKRCCLY